MKKMAAMCMGVSFLSVGMMETYGFKFVVPAFLFMGLALVFVNLKDKPYRAKNRQYSVVTAERASI